MNESKDTALQEEAVIVQAASGSGYSMPDDLLDELDDAMLRLGRLMASRAVGPDCCPHSITMPQALLLRHLNANGPTKMGDIASLLAVKPPAASSAVAGLEKDGLLSRETDNDDRRVTLVHITQEGRVALHTAEEARRVAMRRYLSVLSEEDVRSLIGVHHKLLDAMSDGRV